MKNTKKSRFVLQVIAVIIIMAITSSCAKKVNFQISTEVPAAEGDVKIKKTSNDNYEIDIKLFHLADPARLSPAKDAYVVWMKTENNHTKNLGQISGSSGFLSKKLKATFTTVSAFKPVKIFITAENETSIQYPRGKVILSTSDF